MGILGAYSGDLIACTNGDDEACRRVAFGYYVWPHIQRVLKELELAELPTVIPQPPIPDPPAFEFPQAVAAFIVAPMFEPDPDPNRMVAARLDALKTAQVALERISGELDRQIDALS